MENLAPVMSNTSAASSPLTIAILSSQYVVWLGLKDILESSATVPMIVLPCPVRISELLHAERQPNVFILDLDTEHDAIGTIKQIRKAAPTSKVVLLSGFDGQEGTRHVFTMGVDGIILKVQPPEVVLTVIEGLYAPAKFPVCVKLEDRWARRTSLKKLADSDPAPAWPDALTEREREIVHLVEQGLSNKDIAYKLAISDSTVRHHMTSIFDKVGVPNRQKLLVHAHHFRLSPI